MSVAVVPIEDPDWGAFVAANRHAGPFHLPAWASLLADCYRFRAFALTASDADGEILGGIPVVAVRLPLGRLRWVSLPFSDSCSVLARPDISMEVVVSALENHVADSRVHGLEIRSALPAGENRHRVDAGYVHLVELPPDPAGLRPQRNFRQHRNQAMNRGVRVTRGSDSKDIALYYRLHTLTRRRLGVPVQPRRFFDLLATRILAAGNGFVATATLDEEALAACLCLTHNGTIVAKYQASDPDRRDTGAGHLMHWEIMSAACVEGYHTYDLGRTDPEADGLRAFKTRMGALEEPLVYTHIAPKAPRERRHGGGDLSQRVIRTSPAWVCRAMGEAFYRWTA